MKKLAFCILMLGFGVAGAEEETWTDVAARVNAEYRAKKAAEEQAEVLRRIERNQREQLRLAEKAAKQAAMVEAQRRIDLEEAEKRDASRNRNLRVILENRD
jgi:serine/threonine protein kinase HipA of HipAB toxin-antitoxin module